MVKAAKAKTLRMERYGHEQVREGQAASFYTLGKNGTERMSKALYKVILVGMNHFLDDGGVVAGSAKDSVKRFWSTLTLVAGLAVAGRISVALKAALVVNEGNATLTVRAEPGIGFATPKADKGKKRSAKTTS